jgi:hypothetical protein
MKTYKYIIIAVLVMLFASGCNDYLDLKPTNKVTADNVFASQAGIEAFLANLYHNLPIEDFNCAPRQGMNFNPGDAQNGGVFEYTITDDGINSQYSEINDGASYTQQWEPFYQLNKDINLFFSYIPNITVIDESTRRMLYGEAWFMRAYTYYGLAKRYGGVPIITSIADIKDTEALNVPRSTEKATWDYAIAACDSAAYYLGNGDGKRRRASKWAALALKSRIALHAASVAKYWDKAPLSGPAVDAGLVGGMTQQDAEYFFNHCISASAEIIDNGNFTLYGATPASPEEAEVNYRTMFEAPNKALSEVILIKGFDRLDAGYGSNQDVWANPAQTAGAWVQPGRFNPSLQLADTYESYTNEGHAAPLVTTTDGSVDFGGYNASKTYLKFNDPTEIFKDKDARMHATLILPSSQWKGIKIVIQGGLIKPDGTAVIENGNDPVVKDGVSYYPYGAAAQTQYSGFDTYMNNYTRTGFLFRKFLNPGYTPELAWNRSNTDYIDMRYAEVLLNYAEAVAETNNGEHQAKAAKAINDIRKRAAFQTDIPLTLENVLRERRVELAFESRRVWDLVRRREYHEFFTQGKRAALVPVLDLRDMKYIFVRQVVSASQPMTFLARDYYKAIPGIAANGLIQNPQY